MKIAGLQKLSLVDYPGSNCATIFTPFCSFRCPFCHNSNIAFIANISDSDLIKEEDVFAFLKKRKNLLNGICISGGEPTLQDDLEVFIHKAKDMGYKVKLDTNGNNPYVLSSLIESKLLDYVAMDVKSSLENYHTSVGLVNFDTSKIEKSINLLKEGRVDYEFRTTIVKELHNTRTIEDMAHLLSGAKLWRLQEFCQSSFVPDASLEAIDKNTLCSIIEKIDEKPYNIKIYG